MALYPPPTDDRLYWPYNINFYDANIRTTVTKSPTVVDRWINEIQHIHRHRLQKLLAGISTKWRAERDGKSPVATLQLCVGRRCLIFQLLHTPTIPLSLYAFLNNQNFTFVGGWMNRRLKRLLEDHKLRIARTMDLGYLAGLIYEMKGINGMSLEKLALVVLGKEMRRRPSGVVRGKWDNVNLSFEQVVLACIDAFISFEIGMSLYWHKG